VWILDLERRMWRQCKVEHHHPLIESLLSLPFYLPLLGVYSVQVSRPATANRYGPTSVQVIKGPSLQQQINTWGALHTAVLVNNNTLVVYGGVRPSSQVDRTDLAARVHFEHAEGVWEVHVSTIEPVRMGVLGVSTRHFLSTVESVVRGVDGQAAMQVASEAIQQLGGTPAEDPEQWAADLLHASLPTLNGANQPPSQGGASAPGERREVLQVDSIVPMAVKGHSAVWTGKEMLMFGGCASATTASVADALVVMRPLPPYDNFKHGGM